MTSRERIQAAISHKPMEILSKDDGFVFNTVHNILPDVHPRNIIAMFDAVKEFNKSK